ncbi:E3 ubiquitin-protein ligase MARCH3 [Orussus abietinus]|uniref:E3 ubiquitin-protein ligase MARCH3 n=1 Tax=Orussus abietinus TaxID=222816 RepID=UPI0006262BC0|nr:E3 ubiquitin-protein ligase MARCH3 [Orussus abietinus]
METAKTSTATQSVLPEDVETPSPCFRRNMTPEKRSTSSINCRICHEDGNLEDLIDPCECSGTLALIHASCLEKWLSTSNTDHCEICKYPYSIKRKNKPVLKSFYLWWNTRSVHGPQGVAGDLLCLMVLTPLCIMATYLCGIGASAYSKLGFWEGTGLAILCCMLVATYCIWFTVTLRFHFSSWRQWCRRNQDVTLLVKHKPVERPYLKSPQDDNNNNNNIGSGYESSVNHFPWCGMMFDQNRDHLYNLQHQTSFV